MRLPAVEYSERRESFLVNLRSREFQARFGSIDELGPLQRLYEDLEYRIQNLAWTLNEPMYDIFNL